MIRILCRIIW